MGRQDNATAKSARVHRPMRKDQLPSKTCDTCSRPFTWRKKWARVWDDVKYCSKRCAGQRLASR